LPQAPGGGGGGGGGHASHLTKEERDAMGGRSKYVREGLGSRRQTVVERPVESLILE